MVGSAGFAPASRSLEHWYSSVETGTDMASQVGIEPTSPGLESGILPLYYRLKFGAGPDIMAIRFVESR